METTTRSRPRAAMIVTDMHPSRRRLADIAEAMLPLARRQVAQQQIMSWQGYAPTPLHMLPGLAGRLGVGKVWCKDEGSRFGLGPLRGTLGPAVLILAGLYLLLRRRPRSASGA